MSPSSTLNIDTNYSSLPAMIEEVIAATENEAVETEDGRVLQDIEAHEALVAKAT